MEIPNFTAHLFPHQITSVLNMEKLEETKETNLGIKAFQCKTNIGILGDLPGFGKSISIVALIARDKMEWNMKKKYEVNNIQTTAYGNIQYITTRSYQKLKPTLILASTSLIAQWKKELSHAKDLNVEIITKTAHIDKIDYNKVDVILCSDTMYNFLMEDNVDKAFKRFIFDEASSTHIKRMKPCRGGFLWFVTATYENLRRIRGTSDNFVKAIFKPMDDSIFKSILVKNPDEEVKKSFSMPPINSITYQCLNPYIIKIMKNFVSQTVLDMMNAGDIAGAIQDLGGKESDCNLVELVKRNKMKEYDRAVFNMDNALKYKDTDNYYKSKYPEYVAQVKKIGKELSDLDERFKDMLQSDCPICQDTISKPVLMPCCQNCFCGECVLTWMKKNTTCPMCRTNIDPKKLVYIKQDNSKSSKEEKEENVKEENVKTKQETIVDIIKKKKGKFLVFSSYDMSFELIKNVLKNSSINFIEMKGQQSSREKKLKRFQEENIDVLFLNSRFNGAGLNLQFATDIILYHSLDELLEKQVIGRCTRIGRKNILNIHRLSDE